MKVNTIFSGYTCILNKLKQFKKKMVDYIVDLY